MTILIVEDDDITANMLCGQLKARGFATRRVSPLEVTKELRHSNGVRAVLLDITMPEISGLDLLEQIRRDHTLTQLPVLMVTALQDAKTIQAALHAGANDYIAKPIVMDILATRLETHLKVSKLNQELAASQSFLERLIENLPIALSWKTYRGNKGKYAGFNKKAKALFGKQVTNTKIIGTSDDELFTPELAAHIAKADQIALKRQEAFYLEHEIQEQADGQRHVQRSWRIALPADKNSEQLLITMSQDISEWHDLQERMEEQNAYAFYSARIESIADIAASLAHDVFNPLAIIKGHAQIIGESWQNDPDHPHAQRCHKISKQVDRIRSIISALKEYSASARNEDYNTNSVRDMIASSLAFLVGKFNRTGVALNWEPNAQDWDEIGSVICRKSEIMQVLVNILMNAQTAAAEANEKWVGIEVEASAESVKIAVTDSGDGVPKEWHERIFSPFFTTRPVGHGSGMGLTVCRKILNDHDGHLRLDADAPHTRFIIELPRAPAVARDRAA